MPPKGDWGGVGKPKIDTGMRRGPPGSMEYTRPDLYPNYSPESASQAAQIVSPSLSFRVERDVLGTSLRMLKILERVGFVKAIGFSGPKVQLKSPRGEPVDVTILIRTLESYPAKEGPVKGVSVHLKMDGKKGALAKLKVSGSDRSKVRLKVKGTITMAQWNEVSRRVVKSLMVRL